MDVENTEFDFLIVGSGFGGSVAAMRLSQKGYKVAVIEKGKRFLPQDFAKTNWEIKKFLWLPWLKCFGIQQITLLKGLMLLHGAGVGGGSLVYANTLMEPAEEVFTSKNWPSGVNWKAELSIHFESAKKMLGVTKNRIHSKAEDLMLDLGRQLGVENTFHLTEVGVFFDESRNERDPYFGGEGPLRKPCTGCGACMVGCRDGGKNTLDKNYLYFAEKWGAKVFAERKVIEIKSYGERYKVTTSDVNRVFRSEKSEFRAKKVILSAGVLGSVELLFRNREITKTLPNVSQKLGEHVKTNGESLCGVTGINSEVDLSKGIAIGSAIHPDSHTKIEPVRYNSGSSLMRFLAVPLTPNGNLLTRPLKLIWVLVTRPVQAWRLFSIKNWAEKSVILLVMQTINFELKIKLGRSFFSLGRKSLVGMATMGAWPSYLEVAQKATKTLARIMNGVAQNAGSEVLLGTPSTAHILGGCVIGDSSETGVIDSNHEVFGHSGLYVCDGSVIPANLGVNPSLTITALAERFCHQFAIKNFELYKSRQLKI